MSFRIEIENDLLWKLIFVMDEQSVLPVPSRNARKLMMLLIPLFCITFVTFSVDYANIYLLSIFFSIDFAWWKSGRLPRIAFIVIH